MITMKATPLAYIFILPFFLTYLYFLLVWMLFPVLVLQPYLYFPIFRVRVLIPQNFY